MSEEIPLPLAKMRKLRRLKAGIKHARKTTKYTKQKVFARKKKKVSIAKTHINLKQPGALTQKSVANLIGSVNDKLNTQLRVTKDGLAFISTSDVGAQRIADLAFRLESFSAGTKHFGLAAAKDAEWVKRIYKVLKDNWPRPSSSYIDLF